MFNVKAKTGYSKPSHFRFILTFNGGPAAPSHVARGALDPAPGNTNPSLPAISSRVVFPEGCTFTRSAVGTYDIAGLPKMKRGVAYSVPGGAGQKGSFSAQNYNPETGTCRLIHRNQAGALADVASSANSMACIMVYGDCGGDQGIIVT